MAAFSYYNDIDKEAADWLRDLMKAGQIPDGEVDERSILEVEPADLVRFTQCHFFAGIGGWPLALKLAGWPADRPCWTGSPPCQPFSAAGEGRSRNDERHLAPKFISLVWAGRPDVLFGEQVASADVFGKATASASKAAAGEPRWAWIDDLSDRLEAAHYAIGTDDTPSASVGAPHIRQRTFFGAYNTRLAAGSLADADRNGQREAGTCIAEGGDDGAFGNRPAIIMADASGAGLQGGERRGASGAKGQSSRHLSERDEFGELADTNGGNAGTERQQRLFSEGVGSIIVADAGSGGGAPGVSEPFERQEGITGKHDDGRGQFDWAEGPSTTTHAGATNGFWSNADWLFCRDLKWRPVEPRTFPLAYGLPRGMAKMPDGLRGLAEVAGLDAGSLRRAKRFRKSSLKGYGNAINHHAAAQFILDFSAAQRDL